MKKLSFTTNIMCGSCLSKVKPKLDADKQVIEWSIDTSSKDKILTVSLDDVGRAEDVIATVQSAGFMATELRA